MIFSLLVTFLVYLGLLGIATVAIWGILAILGEPVVSEDSFLHVMDLLFGDDTQER